MILFMGNFKTAFCVFIHTHQDQEPTMTVKLFSDPPARLFGAFMTPGYKTGDHDQRPWGSYVVTDAGMDSAGKEYCEKEITVNPGQVLSLQSHALRRERWIVKRGVLTVIVDGCRIDLQEKDNMEVPLGSIHCMANLGDFPCIVHERQTGVCREEDIKRLCDAYGRETHGTGLPGAYPSIVLYKQLLTEIKKLAA
jgi:mannose-6-phosphate isomerase-like protein (cupin superfamily)